MLYATVQRATPTSPALACGGKKVDDAVADVICQHVDVIAAMHPHGHGWVGGGIRGMQ